VCEKGGGGVGNDYNLLIYNVCMLHRRWGRWGPLLVLQRVVLVAAGGGAEKFFYWLGNGCDVRVGRWTELVSICNDNVTGRTRRGGEHRVWV
jgi:hypothetical protein